MIYEFGIMDNKYELKSEDDVLAKVAMCLFYKKNIPIAIYKPNKEAILPEKILETNKEYCEAKGEELIKIFQSIKEEDLKDAE